MASIWFTVVTQLFVIAVFVVVAMGLALRHRDIFVPEEGLGYALGIIGGTSMLLLLFYPLVKRVGFLGFRNHSVFWLRVHMVLGTLGPLLIFFHSNFSLGATNSNVALASMIVVAASGVAGRYIYTRVHRGMSAVKLDLNTLLANSARLMAIVGDDAGGNNAIIATSMADFARQTMPDRRGLMRDLVGTVILPWRVSFARSRMMAEVRRAVATNAVSAGWTRKECRRRVTAARHHVNEYLHQVGRASQLAFWEHMFSLWHVLHVPLFFILLVSGVVHVVAVHLY